MRSLALLLLLFPIIAATDCGYVGSTTMPPLSEDLYPAEIRRIDGEELGAQGQPPPAAGRQA